MKTNNIIQEKTFQFSIEIVKIAKLIRDKKEYELASQIIKSGTSIGANIEEALGAQSDKDFLSKMSIAYKEARETKYWIRLLRATDSIDTEIEKNMIEKIEEICRIIGKIQVTLKNKIRNS